MANWITCDLSKEVKEKYSFQPHSPHKVKYFPWMVCGNYMKTAITAWNIGKGCNAGLLPEFQTQCVASSRK